MRGAASGALLVLLAAAARAQDAAQWARLDALLPPPLLRVLPTLLHIIGDICELSTADGGPTLAEDFEVIEHSAFGKERYAVREVAAKLASRGAGGGRVAVYVGGWGNKLGDSAARALVPALLGDHRLVLELDVGAAFAGEYPAAAARVGAVARAVAALLAGVARAGLAAARLHAVGFSLGAHAAGAGARAARAAGAGALGRLTALDPARPCFARGAAARWWRVSRADARFVQVVHSSAGALGLARPLGHVDVYAREGRGAGAAALVRAHNAAWLLWSRSARAPLLARRCRPPQPTPPPVPPPARATPRCTGERVSVGYHCSHDMRGLFLLEANTNITSTSTV